MPDYKNGKIYKLWCPNNDLVYIGSTTSPLHKRLYEHKKSSNNLANKPTSHLLFETGDEVRIELIEEYSCNNRMELNRKEGDWIRTTHCVNRCVAGRTSKEDKADNAYKINDRMKQYYKDNVDEKKAKNKQYYKDNADKMIADNKLYRRANRDRVNARRRESRKEKKERFVTQ